MPELVLGTEYPYVVVALELLPVVLSFSILSCLEEQHIIKDEGV